MFIAEPGEPTHASAKIRIGENVNAAFRRNSPFLANARDVFSVRLLIACQAFDNLYTNQIVVIKPSGTAFGDMPHFAFEYAGRT